MEIVNVKNVSKKFSRIHKESMRYGLLSILHKFLGITKSKTLKGAEFWAVNDVSFQLERGESLGIIGLNGSGKTTLLKMISGIIESDSGSIKTNGKIVPLFAKGAGFDPILSGNENIKINLSLLGLKAEEIEAVKVEVISFSELSPEVLSSPVKTYSSGMHARLGFACAICARPDILIVDEALAVGDMKFRAKCYRKLHELKTNGCSIILVSHSTSVMMNNCTKGLFLKNGVTQVFGDIQEVVQAYEKSLEEVQQSFHPKDNVNDELDLFINQVKLLNPENEDVTNLIAGEFAKIKLSFVTKQPYKDLTATFLVKSVSQNLENVLDMTSLRDNILFQVEAGHYDLEVNLPTLNLAPGQYILKVFISEQNISNMLDAVEAVSFTVSSEKDFVTSKFFQPRQWYLKRSAT